MAFITREDGARFVIPAYRDVITAKSLSVLKKEITILCNNYGNYITLQRKGPIQYEIAFSPDAGYLLGESVWHYFKRPMDMIYCEALPNGIEAILVIVKAGSVYLDGSFPLESIPEELVVFLTQQNNFDIYVYGDVPISQTSEVGKFSFDSNAVRSFTVLEKPAFPDIQLIKLYQLQHESIVLKAQGIGVFPVKKMAVIAAIFGVLWMMWSLMTASSKTQVTNIIINQVNPYQPYYDLLMSPKPEDVVNEVLKRVALLYSMPGWKVAQVNYASGMLVANVRSDGTNIGTIVSWADRNGATTDLDSKGILIKFPIPLPKRPMPQKIFSLKQAIIHFSDRLAVVYPGNHMSVGAISPHSVYQNAAITVSIENMAPSVIMLIGEQSRGLPFTLQSMLLTPSESDGLLSGTIILQAAGN